MNNNKNSSRITTIIIFVLIGIIILVGLIAFNVTGNLFGDNNSIALSEKNIEMRKGESLQFETTTKNREELIYTSSNPNIVSVNEITGLVIANGYGTATITVSLKSNNKIKDECIVTVVKPQNGVEVSSISLTPSSITLQVGSTKQLTYKIMPTDASNKKTYWSTSNSEVATIDKNGIVTAKSVGTAKIKIRTENGAFATCDVTVSNSSNQNPTPTTTYTLTYNANGGSVSPGSKTLNKGAQYGSLPTPTRSGYTFNGWYTASSGGSKVSSNTTINGNTTIYAQWTKNSTPTQIPNMTCTGTITRAGTKITVSPSSNDVKEYKWVINGKTINGTNTYSEYKIIDKASVNVLFKDGQKKEVKCTIQDKLIYHFNYDLTKKSDGSSLGGKPYFKCDVYTASDRKKYEKMLKNAIKEAGYGTRAGAVEAARFMMGGMDYMVGYQGPKKGNYDIGRYPHVGLNIGNSKAWGCNMQATSGGGYYKQGIDCTNYIDWIMIQNGLSIAAYNDGHKPVSEVVDKLRVGDFLYSWTSQKGISHVAIIVGVDKKYIYYAEGGGGISRTKKSTLKKRSSEGSLSRAYFPKYPKNGDVKDLWLTK